MKNGNTAVFDYRALRLTMGIIALTLPFVVTLVSSAKLTSISASYYTEARDVFVGMLFIVGSFLWAYNGHTPAQSRFSKVAGLAAMVVALFPTACDTCATTPRSLLHYGAAATLFGILAYFCLGPFREKTKGMTGKKGRRAKVYLVSGIVMLAALLVAFAGNFLLPQSVIAELRLTFWAEAIALIAFGIAWITAGKYLAFMTDANESLAGPPGS